MRVLSAANLPEDSYICINGLYEEKIELFSQMLCLQDPLVGEETDVRKIRLASFDWVEFIELATEFDKHPTNNELYLAGLGLIKDRDNSSYSIVEIYNQEGSFYNFTILAHSGDFRQIVSKYLFLSASRQDANLRARTVSFEIVGYTSVVARSDKEAITDFKRTLTVNYEDNIGAAIPATVTSIQIIGIS